MANDLVHNPIYLDTAGATSAVARPLSISALVWTGASSAGHSVTIKDGPVGNVLFTLTSQSQDPVVVHFARPYHVPGLYVSAKSSGTVLVYS